MKKGEKMFLEKVNTLPHKLIKRFDDELKGLNVYLVQDYDLKLLKEIVSFSEKVFGEASLDEWGIVPQIRRGNVLLLKEEAHKKVLGFAILMRDWDDDDKVYLFDIAIADEYQGAGVGYYFLESIIENCKDQGFKRMSLTVDIDNARAIRLYKEKLGFEIIKREDHEYGQNEHRYEMELEFAELSDTV